MTTSRGSAIKKINSVDVKTETKDAPLPWLAAGFEALILATAVVNSESSQTRIVNAPLAAGLLTLAVRMYRLSLPTTTYRLLLMTSSPQIQVHSTRSRPDIEELQHAIEQPIINA